MNSDPPRRSTRPAFPAPPPPSTDPRSHRRDLIQTAPELPSPRSRPAPITARPPASVPASTGGPASAPEPIASRREIKTVPGGGLNRISDGRAAAAAYVGIKTLPVVPKQAPPTMSKVKLARDLLVDNKEFRTEPALRSQSFPPPVPSRVTPITPRRTLVSLRRGSPQAVMTLVAMLAVAVGVLSVVATGGRWMSQPEPAETAAPPAEVQWDNGIDGQPGVLVPPLAPPAAPQDTAAGQLADVGPSAQSADPTPPAPREVAPRPATPRPPISGNDPAPRPKVDPEVESGLASSGASRTGASSRPPRPSPAPSSQPERAPPQPWLE